MAYLEEQEGEAKNEYLYSTIGAAFDSATLAKGAVDADSDGNRLLQKGTVLAKILSGVDSGKVGPYDTGASDGREEVDNIIGISETYLDVSNGDLEIAYLYKGTVTESRVYSNGVQGNVGDTVKNALRTSKADVLFR